MNVMELGRGGTRMSVCMLKKSEISIMVAGIVGVVSFPRGFSFARLLRLLRQTIHFLFPSWLRFLVLSCLRSSCLEDSGKVVRVRVRGKRYKRAKETAIRSWIGTRIKVIGRAIGLRYVL